MPEIEFQVDAKALEVVKNTELSANFEQVEAQLTALTAPYRTMVVTMESIASAKTDRAKIRKLEKSLDDYRKAVKTAYMEPYNAFEARYKKLIGICKETSENIDTQVKRFEEQQKAEKVAGLRNFFEQNADGVSGYLKFEQIFNKRWENATFALEDAQEEILTAIQKCEGDLNAIRGLNSPFESELLSTYSATLDIAGCMRKHAELTEIKRREDERRRAEEEARKQREVEEAARRKALEEAEAKRKAEQESELAKFAAEAPKPAEPYIPTVKYSPEPEKPAETVYSINFCVNATKSQLFDLKAACDRIGITIKRI